MSVNSLSRLSEIKNSSRSAWNLNVRVNSSVEVNNHRKCEVCVSDASPHSRRVAEGERSLGNEKKSTNDRIKREIIFRQVRLAITIE